MQRNIVPHVVRERELAFAAPRPGVRDAAQLMASRRIGAMGIGDADCLLGIFAERA